MENNKFNIVMIGHEESLDIYDSGHRSRMISKSLADSDFTGKILIIYCPVSLLRRMRTGKNENLSSKYRCIKKNLLSSFYQVNEKTVMLSITALIPESDNLFSKFERKLIAQKIVKFIKKSGINYNMLWISNPRIIDIASKIKLKLKAFDAIDNLLLHPQMKNLHNKIKTAYEWVTQNTDLIFIASEKQRSIFEGNPNIRLLPNGVDKIFFDCGRDSTLHDDFTSISRPVIGYCGAVQNRLDSELLLEVAGNLPEYNFVFIGPIMDEKNIEILKQKKNVHFLGHKNFSEIPDYISMFDVAVIPHRIDEFTESMNPLKVYEYLACGKPVITTPVNGTSQFRELIYIAEKPEEFTRMIRKAISENSKNLSENRKNSVKSHSWNLILQKCFSEIEI